MNEKLTNEKLTFDFSRADINAAESLIQIPLFRDELDALRAHPYTLPLTALSERTVMMQAVLRMTQDYRGANSADKGDWWLTHQAYQEIIRTHATDIRLIARQLIMINNLEKFAVSRTPQPHMQAAKETHKDALSRLADFMCTHQQNESGQPKGTVYDLLRKNGEVSALTEAHQDYIMAVLLREAGIGKPAAEEYPAPLRALIVTPTPSDTYRLAYRRHGNSVFRVHAPEIVFITTRRYRGLIDNRGAHVVVTNPAFLQEAVRSGKMIQTQYDLILTDGLSEDEAKKTHTLVHGQRIGPVVINFVVGATPTT